MDKIFDLTKKEKKLSRKAILRPFFNLYCKLKRQNNLNTEFENYINGDKITSSNSAETDFGYDARSFLEIKKNEFYIENP